MKIPKIFIMITRVRSNQGLGMYSKVIDDADDGLFSMMIPNDVKLKAIKGLKKKERVSRQGEVFWNLKPICLVKQISWL